MFAVTALILALGGAPADIPPPSFAHVRTVWPDLQRLVTDAEEGSETFALLMDRLRNSDVVVYLHLVPTLPYGATGQLQLIGKSGSYRYLRVSIPVSLPRQDFIASLAHELWHAIEIADHPDVCCQKTLRDLYCRIGTERRPKSFETLEALKVGRRVRAEIFTVRGP